jgi:hypothetical protein
MSRGHISRQPATEDGILDTREGRSALKSLLDPQHRDEWTLEGYHGKAPAGALIAQ